MTFRRAQAIALAHTKRQAEEREALIRVHVARTIRQIEDLLKTEAAR
jgi:hypothetical protein